MLSYLQQLLMIFIIITYHHYTTSYSYLVTWKHHPNMRMMNNHRFLSTNTHHHRTNRLRLQMGILDHMKQFFYFSKPSSYRLIADNDELLHIYQQKVYQINRLETSMNQLTNEQLQEKTMELKQRFKRGELINAMMIEVFAIIKEVCGRVLNYRQSDYQVKLSSIIIYLLF